MAGALAATTLTLIAGGLARAYFPEQPPERLAGLLAVVVLVVLAVAFLPAFGRRLRRLSGEISTPSPDERAYLESLIKDLEHRNSLSNWADSLYIPLTSELREPDSYLRLQERILQSSYYLVRTIHPSTPRQIFNTFSNVEKVDSSRGTTFSSLASAVDHADDNAVIVLASPGGGKTVSLRNLALADALARLARRTSLVPIFLNLGHYVGYDADGNVQPFPQFLESFFAESGYYSFLSAGRWKELLQRDHCVFYLDALDELPRRHPEYQKRAKAIEAFIQQWPQTRFVLACREQDFDHQLTFQQVLIKPFGYRQINSYLRRYFDPSRSSAVLEGLLGNEALLELCANPFYLNLVCLYCKATGKLPESRVQLFQFLVDSVVRRENAKLANPADHFAVADFVDALSQLAFFMAVVQQSTTINLDQYRAWLARDGARDRHDRMIRHASASDLLTFNEQSNEIRFSHNRFQEFFSSFVFVQRYRTEGFAFPANFFTNIWWVETILFIAGLDDNVSDFIRVLLTARERIVGPNEVIGRLLSLDLLLLAFRSIFANLQFSDEPLREKVRALLFEEFERGTPLERAKIVSALKLDDSPVVRDFLRRALDDQSSWVSESAFFAISSGELQFQVTYRTVLREFFRFFREGRLFSTVLPVFRASRQSRKVRTLLPVFVLLILANIACWVAIVGVLTGFVHFLLFKLSYAFTSWCIQCLYTLSLGAFAIAWYLARGTGRLLRRAILVAPLAVLVHLHVFAGPALEDPWAVRGASIGAGLLVATAYRRLLGRRREHWLSLWTVTTFLLGWLLGLGGIRLLVAPKAPVADSVFGGPIGEAILASIKEHVQRDIRESLAARLKPQPVGRSASGSWGIDMAIREVERKVSQLEIEPRVAEMMAQAGVSAEQVKRDLLVKIRTSVDEARWSGRLRRPEDLDSAVQRGIARGVEPVAERVSAFRLGRWLFYGVISLMSLVLLGLILRQLSVVIHLGRHRKSVIDCLRSSDGEDARITTLIQTINAQPAVWARHLLVDLLVTEIVTAEGREHVEAITFLSQLATKMSDSDLQDTVLRELEHEQRSYRRGLQANVTEQPRPASGERLKAGHPRWGAEYL